MSRLRLEIRPWLLATLAGSTVAATAALAFTRPTDGPLSVIVALLLAPVAVWSIVAIGERLAGSRFGVAAAIVYVLLPFAGRFLFYGPFVEIYRREIAPALVGLRSTGWFALGVAIALGIAFAPLRAAAVAGIAALGVALVEWAGTDWTRLYDNFHETTWSPTLLSLLPFACVLAVGLRSPLLAAALGGWIGFFILRGADRSYADGGFWLSLAAATPAAALLLTSLGLLVPRLRPARAPAPPPASTPS
ncbi:MAG TPA: hypothetical protein VLK36_15020 [Gaiellaceae bacterium]|nr:hypothetical protein [Gaiellaceae bacterium]